MEPIYAFMLHNYIQCNFTIIQKCSTISGGISCWTSVYNIDTFLHIIDRLTRKHIGFLQPWKLAMRSNISQPLTGGSPGYDHAPSKCKTWLVTRYNTLLDGARTREAGSTFLSGFWISVRGWTQGKWLGTNPSIVTPLPKLAYFSSGFS